MDGGPAGSGADYDIAVRHGPEALAGADTVVIPPSHALDEVLSTATLPPPIAAALCRIRPGTRLIAMCTGAFVLAAAGVLDGRRAVTHWAEAANLAALFPSVTVDHDALYIDEGDVLTSAGIAAGIDLCMHVIRRDHGTQVAAQVARECVVSPQREGGLRQDAAGGQRPDGRADRRPGRAGHRCQPAPAIPCLPGRIPGGIPPHFPAGSLSNLAA